MLQTKITAILLLLSGCVYATVAQPTDNNLNVNIVEEFVIGNNPSLPIENSLGTPETIFTDSENIIYIADKGALTIRVFSKDGEFLKNIGQRGRGPGEFLSLGHVFINEKDKIYAPDPMQFRITKFNTDGEVLDTYSTSPKSQDINFFRQVLPLGNNEYLTVYKQNGAGRFAQYASDFLFHVWDPTFQNKVRASGSFKKLGYSDPYGKRFVKSKLGRIVRISENELLLAPHLYRGVIFQYTRKGSEWVLDKKISGYQTDQPASITLDENDPNARINHSYGEETIAGRVNIVSSGIFNLNDKYITHFSIRRDRETKEENWIFGVELFDIEQNFLGYYPLETLDNLYTTYDPLVQWKDDEDRFYMLDQEEGVPVVRVFSLDIQEN